MMPLHSPSGLPAGFPSQSPAQLRLRIPKKSSPTGVCRNGCKIQCHLFNFDNEKYKKRNETKKPSPVAAYIIIAIEHRPLGDAKKSSRGFSPSHKVCAHNHTERSRLGLLIAVAAAGLGVLDVLCGVVLSVGDG
jgi:hypothetical protein